MIKLKNLITEKKEKFDLELFKKNIKNYTKINGEWTTNVPLTKLFSNLNLPLLKKEYPEIFQVPSKYRGANVYYYRGTAKPFSYLQNLKTPDEIYDVPHVGKCLLWNDKKIKVSRGIGSFTIYPNVANGFAENSSGYNTPPYNLKSNLPVLYLVEAKDKRFFMNTDWLSKISGKKEGELFHEGGHIKADIAVLLDDQLHEIYKDIIKTF